MVPSSSSSPALFARWSLKLRRGKEQQRRQRQLVESLGLRRDLARHCLQKVAGQMEQGKRMAWLLPPQHLHICCLSSQSTEISLCLQSAQEGRPSVGWRGTTPAGRSTWQLQQRQSEEVSIVAPRRRRHPGAPQSHNFVAPITSRKAF